MSLDKFLELKAVVPNVPELLLDTCSRSSAFTREEIIKMQRISLLVLLQRVTSGQTSTHLYSSILNNSNFLKTFHTEIDINLLSVTPQQVQYISLLADFIIKNPNVIIKTLQHQYSHQTNGFFNHLCYSSIPAFFGHFSSNEHLNSAFPFYCTLIGTLDERILDHILLPFYCNGCTYRFIEYLYASFGLQFCHDLRLDSKKIQYDILKQYEQPLINSIIQSYPLLPQTHQFLLKFMIRRGRKENNVLNFFIHKFTLPQLLRYVKSTPFTSHFQQLKALAICMQRKMTNCLSILDVFISPSFFEVPPAFSVFDTPFTQLLLTTLDVHIMMTSLSQINELPTHLNTFKDLLYFKKIDMIPIWVKIYSRKPKPMDASFNWKSLIFLPLSNHSEKSSKVEKPAAFERMYRQLKQQNDSKNINPVDFLYGKCSLMEDKLASQRLKKQLNQKYQKFVNFVLVEELNDLNDKSQVFEHYLCHSLALVTLKEWKSIVEANYLTMILPIIQSQFEKIITIKGKLQPNAESISFILKESMDTIEYPLVKQLLFMTIIQKILPMIVPNKLLAKLKLVENEWIRHLMRFREKIILPDAFRNSKNNQRTALLLNRKLWAAIEHLGCIKYVQFEWTLKLILDTMNQLDELSKMDDAEGSVVQFALAFCDSPLLISRFIIINIFVVKQKTIRAMTNENKDLLLWSRFESSILRILSKNEKLMTSFLGFQDELNFYQI